MFKPTDATSIETYIAAIEPSRRQEVEKLHAFIVQTVPNLKPHFASNMLGYGSFPYTNYKKQTISWPVIALASQKNYISLYICALHEGTYLAEKFQDSLGKVSVGKSCIRFKKISDLNLESMAKIMRLAAANPGLRS